MHPALYGCRFGLIAAVVCSKRDIRLKKYCAADVCSLFLLGMQFFKQTISTGKSLRGFGVVILYPAV
ncbi:MAG: hypothetical protein OIF58_08495, partial [Cohaesibacter sp.]|nr:hypothetical protein [Cohaesibacter sp.]